MARVIERAKRYLKTFPKKHHVEYITGILSVPVLLTAIALNILNLQGNAKKVPVPTPVNEKPIIVQVTGSDNKQTAQPTNTPACKKEVGPINITSPKENETVNSQPVCFTIKYDNENYCSVVWSYRINGSTWSDYNSNSPCLYSLPNGNVKFELRVQSTVSQDEETIERNFIYNGAAATPLPTTSPTP